MVADNTSDNDSASLKETVCQLCSEVVDASKFHITCKCGVIYHRRCATRQGTCRCGNPMSGSADAAKAAVDDAKEMGIELFGSDDGLEQHRVGWEEVNLGEDTVDEALVGPDAFDGRGNRDMIQNLECCLCGTGLYGDDYIYQMRAVEARHYESISYFGIYPATPIEESLFFCGDCCPPKNADSVLKKIRGLADRLKDLKMKVWIFNVRLHPTEGKGFKLKRIFDKLDTFLKQGGY